MAGWGWGSGGSGDSWLVVVLMVGQPRVSGREWVLKWREARGTGRLLLWGAAHMHAAGITCKAHARKPRERWAAHRACTISPKHKTSTQAHTHAHPPPCARGRWTARHAWTCQLATNKPSSNKTHHNTSPHPPPCGRGRWTARRAWTCRARRGCPQCRRASLSSSASGTPPTPARQSS